jgi:hypothetical protein
MIDNHPRAAILIGFFLVSLGVVLSMLMVFQVLPSTLLLNILTYCSSISGLMLGMIGGGLYIKKNRKKEE